MARGRKSGGSLGGCLFLILMFVGCSSLVNNSDKQAKQPTPPAAATNTAPIPAYVPPEPAPAPRPARAARPANRPTTKGNAGAPDWAASEAQVQEFNRAMGYDAAGNPQPVQAPSYANAGPQGYVYTPSRRTRRHYSSGFPASYRAARSRATAVRRRRRGLPGTMRECRIGAMIGFTNFPPASSGSSIPSASKT